MRPPNPLSAGGFDRAAQRRRDPAWLAARLADPASRFFPLWNGKVLVQQAPEPRAVSLEPAGLDRILAPRTAPVLLGEENGAACFAVEVESEEQAAALGRYGAFEELRISGRLLDARHVSLLAYAKALLHWHSRTKFCGSCGAPLLVRDAGHLRVCENEACKTQHFPRTDPAIIVLVTRGARCLLGHNPAWDAKRYSTLAGFVEPGESLEDAVTREVLEETGVRVAACWYHSSQPWPFPSSMMIGFYAAAETEDLQLDRHEISDARWLSRAELRAATAAREIVLPPRLSISRRLIEDWVNEEPAS